MKNIFTAFRFFMLFLFLFLIGNSLLAQTTTQAGPWNLGSTWAGSNVPSAGASVVIDHNVTLDTDPVINDLTINSGATLQLADKNITVDGTTTINGTIDRNTGHPSVPYIATFNGDVSNNGTFTSTGTDGRRFNFSGNITNDTGATFALGAIGNSTIYGFQGMDQTITNNSSIPMVFASGGSGFGVLNSGTNLTIASTLGGKVRLEGNFFQVNGTLTNNHNLRLTNLNSSINGSITNNGYLEHTGTNFPFPSITLTHGTSSTFAYILNTIPVFPSVYNNLLFDGSTATLTSNITVNGNLTINSGATLDVTNLNYDIDIKGNWTTNGTFNDRIGTITFSGTTLQNIINDTNFSFMVVNNTSNISLQGSISSIGVSNLAFINGKILLNNSNIGCSNITGMNSGNYLVTNGLGRLINASGDSNVLFPVGSITEYQPLVLSDLNIPARVRFGIANPTPHPALNSGVGSWFVDNGSKTGVTINIAPTGGTLDANSKIHRYNSGWGSPLSTVYSGSPPPNYSSTYNFTGGQEEFSVFTPPAPTQPLGNRGMYFDGVDDQVTSSLLPTNDIDDITLSFWIKKQADQVGSVIYNGIDGTDGYGISLSVTSQVVLELGGVGSFPSDITLVTNEWAHISVSRNAGTWGIYKNSTPASFIGTPSIPFVPTVNLQIGKTATTTPSFLGQIDEVRIFNIVRSAAQIAADMASTTPTTEVGFWRFETGTGTEALDELGTNNGNLATGTATPLWALRVKNTNDSGSESLRQVITQANTLVGKNYIDFSIDAPGVQTITPLTSDLPPITDPVIIDGYSQKGSIKNTLAVGINANLLIEIRGSATRNNGLSFSTGSDNSEVYGLVINGFTFDGFSSGITVNVPSVTIAGCFIGTNTTGTAAIKNSRGISTFSSNSNLSLGLPTNEGRNLISGNEIAIGLDGSSGNRVRNNYIGTTASGTTALGNTVEGLILFGSNAVIGGNTAAARNVICANGQGNISLIFTAPQNNTIIGNYIGVGADGIAALGGGSLGNIIWLSDGISGTKIGGIAAGEGNLIANSVRGVAVRVGSTSINNSIRGNSIYSNTVGIDNGNDGITANDANDADTGPNRLQNYPVITSAQLSGTVINVEFLVDATTANSAYGTTGLKVDFYRSDLNRQGKEYLGTINYPSTSAQATLTGVSVPAGSIVVGDYILATATDDNGNTSEFSVEFLLTGTFYSRDATLGGNWNTAASWAIGSHSGTTSSIVPPAGATVIIKNGHTITADIPISPSSITLAGTLDLANFGHILPSTVSILNSGGTGKLRIGGGMAANSISPTIGDFFTTAGNVVEFYGAGTYDILNRNYPTIEVSGTGGRNILGGVDVTIFGNLRATTGVNFSSLAKVIFPNSGTLPHLIEGVSGSQITFTNIDINGNTEANSGFGISINETMNIASVITFTSNNQFFQIANPSGLIAGAGTFINRSALNYFSNVTPTIINLDLTSFTNTVVYSGGTAAPFPTTYDNVVFRDSRSTVAGTITANNIIFDNSGVAALNLVDGTIITAGTLSNTNTSSSTIDFGTGNATLTVNGDMSGGTTLAIIHNPATTSSQLLDLKGANNTLNTFTSTGLGTSTVRYSGINAQTIFPSPNYQNLEINGGAIKTVQGVTIVNNNLALNDGILDLNVNDLILANAATITGGFATSYIFTGTSNVIKNVSTGSNFNFPIGFGTTSSDFAPISVDYTGIGAVSVSVTNTPSPAITGANRVNAMWSVNGSVTTTIGNINFNWVDINPTVTGTIDATATIYRNVSGSWLSASADGNSVGSVGANAAVLTNSANRTGNFSVFSAAAITVSLTSLPNSFTSCAATPSAEQSYTVSGTNLSADIVINSPSTDFEISLTSGSGFVNSLNLTPASGSVPTTTIYVRQSASASNGASGNITHTSTGATTQNVAITASVVNPSPIVTLSVVNASVCPNTAIDFIATATPTGMYIYEFYINTVLAQNSSPNNLFTATGLATGDQVEVVATDLSGCFGSGTIIMNVADNQVPVLTAMPNFTRNTDPTNCYYTNINATSIPNGVATDDCRVASYEYSLSGATTLTPAPSLQALRFNTGITSVSWTATDANGNTSLPSQFTVTVADVQNPTIQAPQNSTKKTDLYSCTLDSTGINIGTPIVSDNCLVRVFNDAPAEFPIGQTIVIWTALDSAGNTATANQTITIEEQYFVAPSDSLILVQMYNQMGGTFWTNQWNFNTPISTWYGVGVSCGRVASINLSNNNLTGVLPSAVLSLARRTETDFLLNIGGNKLNFESAEDFVGQIANFTYSPQAKIYATRTESILQTESITFNSQTEGNFNNYQWYKNQALITGATNPTFTIPNTAISDAGIYTCKITNTIATQLTLERNPINLVIQGFVNPTDSIALVTIFEETGGTTDWINPWDLTQPVATWEGVTISGNKIRELDLSSRNMTGTLPNVFDAEFFSELRYLSLFNNKLEGQIPVSIGAITTLTYLDLDKNNFEGSVPTSFGNLVNLQALWLSRNNLTNLPDEIGNMRSLKTLYLNDNKFTQLPETIGNLTELLVLNISDNELIDLPNSIANLRKLIQFYANRNYIVAIPIGVQNLVALTVFEINMNSLTTLPNGFLQLSSLSSFKVSENKLEFDDLLPYSNNNYSIFQYAPQAPINEEEDILVALNSSVSFTVQTQGSRNNYQWFRNGSSVAVSQTLTINRVNVNNVGIYTAQVTNSNLPDLTLQRRSITLNVECQAGLSFEIKQPTQTVFCEEQPFGLKLEINDQFTDTDQIRWRKDGIILAFANQKSYTVTSAGIYTAEVLTINGCTAFSDEIEIRVLSQPEIGISLTIQNVFTSILTSQESVAYQWLKDGNPIAEGFESTYTPTQTGEYSLLVLTEAGCSSVSETIIFTTDEVTGIEEPKELRNLEIFPNPNNGNFFVDFGMNTPNGEPTFILIDAIGKQLILKTERISSARYKVNTTNLTGGMYYIQIQTKDGLALRKFVIEE
jgi:Leucine-rich repeat (LRR) protein